MNMYMVTASGGTLTVAREVPDNYIAADPWRVVTLEELEALRDQYERNPVPVSISARQARLWLIRHGITLAQVDAVIAAIPAPLVRESVRVEWEYGTEVHRDSPFVEQLGPAIGLDAAAIDAAFREAAGI